MAAAAYLLTLATTPPTQAQEDPAPDTPAPVYATVRLTYYNLTGLTYAQTQTRYGITACSWNFPLYTRFRFDNGEVFVCEDRGMLGSSGWLDLWNRPDIARLYGPYVTVEVNPQ